LKGLVGKERVIYVSAGVNIGVPITYPRPETIGADRLANACAAAHRYGAPVIVADFGTAVTFDVVEAKRGYVGGIIAPGLMLMFSYLAEKTALLPRIGPALVRGRIGRSTEQAMRLGAKWGYRGLVREILAEIKRKPALRSATVCATGGYARWCLKGSDLSIAVDPHLTLYGLARIYQLNSHDRDAH
jgi:type III pantothenate kinase